MQMRPECEMLARSATRARRSSLPSHTSRSSLAGSAPLVWGVPIMTSLRNWSRALNGPSISGRHDDLTKMASIWLDPRLMSQNRAPVGACR